DVFGHVIQLPAVGAPRPGLCHVPGLVIVVDDGLPAVGPYRPVAVELEVLSVLPAGRIGSAQAVKHAYTVQGPLSASLHHARRLDACRLQDSGHDVAQVVELRPELAGSFDTLRPAHDERHPHTAAVGGLLVVPEGRVAGECPGGTVMGRGVRPSPGGVM